MDERKTRVVLWFIINTAHLKFCSFVTVVIATSFIMTKHGVELHTTFNIIHKKKCKRCTVFKVRVTSFYRRNIFVLFI